MHKIYNADLSQSSLDLQLKQVKKEKEALNWKPEWQIRRFENKKDHKEQMKYDAERLASRLPVELLATYEPKESLDLFGMPQLTRFKHNLLLNEGINELFTLICSSSGTKFDTGAYIGVGDSSTAEDAAHTGLQASSNKLYVAMDGSYPTYGTSQKATWRSTYTSANGNFAWNEFTVANGNSDSSKNLNRKVSSQGTKQSGQTWEISLEITMS
jgi:hypothetical protein